MQLSWQQQQVLACWQQAGLQALWAVPFQLLLRRQSADSSGHSRRRAVCREGGRDG